MHPLKSIKWIVVFIFLSAIFLTGNGFTDYPQNMKEIRQLEYEYLDHLAVAAGTDKSSGFHNYTQAYADYFGFIRKEPIKFLEIGIYGGSSVKLWEWYFPNAELHFIDINPSLISYFSQRSHYHFIDQASRQDLLGFVQSVGGNFDIIIDDGGHKMDQQIISFQSLFPYVKSGGLYIIEDLHTSYWQSFGGEGTFDNPKSGPGTCVSFLQGLVDDLNFTSARIQCADDSKVPNHVRQTLNYYQDHVYSINFYKSLCIIRKK